MLWICLVLMVLLPAEIRCQNNPASQYFTPERVLQFSNHLYEEGEFMSAAAEYERFQFLSPSGPDSVKLRIAKCYLQAERADLANKCLSGLLRSPHAASSSTEASLLLGYTYFLQKKYDSCLAVVRSREGEYIPGAGPVEPEFLLAAACMVARRWDDAEQILKSNTSSDAWEQLNQLELKGRGGAEKSPVLSAMFSAVVPGSGKVYAGKPIDGIFSFIAIGLTAWQSYDGFSRDGTKSAKGWILGSLGLTLYAGNVYGSALEAGVHNQMMYDSFNRDVQLFVKASIRL